MATGVRALRGAVGHDFLFTWKPGNWPEEELRRFVGDFERMGSTEEAWRCAAHKKIRAGDRAYLLKQGSPIGIFGRGLVVGNPRKRIDHAAGESAWRVLLKFDALQGDVLRNPAEGQFLVTERSLLDMSVPKKQWQNQSSGTTLAPNAARAIDDLIFDSLMIGRPGAHWVDEATQEVARLNKLLEHKLRPEQRRFSENIRSSYRGKCAVTGCTTAAALEAAHIRLKKGSDDNGPANGILLRSDIHALFDRLLITLSEDGSRVETSPELKDPTYAHLNTATVARPEQAPPSRENIRDHRSRFFERLSQRGGVESRGEGGSRR